MQWESCVVGCMFIGMVKNEIEVVLHKEECDFKEVWNVTIRYLSQ